nr:hypothetical protein [Mycobacterium avium]
MNREEMHCVVVKI